MKIKIKEIERLLDKQEYTASASLSYTLLERLGTIDPQNEKLIADYYKIGCLLIDIGSEGGIKEHIEKGLSIISEYHYINKLIFQEFSLEYNLGNAKSALFKCGMKDFYKPESALLLTEAKNHYWKAYKALSKIKNSKFLELIVNLANTLKSSIRISEALYYYDYVLKIDPLFPEANINKALCLKLLEAQTNSYTKKMLYEIYKCYQNAIKSSQCNQYLKNQCIMSLATIKSILIENSISVDQIEIDTFENLDEFKGLDDYRQFCLENYLSLTEHGLYCWCNGAARDNLTIPQNYLAISGDFVPKMEFILNRLKSEYSIARKNYYDYIIDNSDYLKNIDNQSCFTNLLNSEILGIAIEKCRLSFRLCFGILDKIARGICELYDLANENEKIYFESFWRNNPGRWDKINNINNPGLFGLYSIATDLNISNGEWSEYKIWRNSLEHGLLTV